MRHATPSSVFSHYQRPPWDTDNPSLLHPFATAAKRSLLLRVFLKLVDVFASMPLSPGSRLLLSISPKLGLKMTYWVNFIYIGAVFDSSWANFVGLFLVGPRYCKAHSPRFKIQRITKNHKKWKQVPLTAWTLSLHTCVCKAFLPVLFVLLVCSSSLLTLFKLMGLGVIGLQKNCKKL